MTLADNILFCRKKNNMTQEELAEALGVSRQSVGKWESGQSLPDLDKVVCMSGLFRIPIDLLVDGNPAAYPASAEEPAPVADVSPPPAPDASAPDTSKTRVSAGGKKRWLLPVIAAALAVGAAVLALVLSGKSTPAARETAASPASGQADSTADAAATPKGTKKPAVFLTPTPEPGVEPLTQKGYGNHPSVLASATARYGARAVEWNGKIVYATSTAVYTMMPDGSNITMLYDGGGGSVNAVGNSLFFCDTTTRTSIVRIDADGGKYWYDVRSGLIEYLCYYDGYLYYMESRQDGGSDTYHWCRLTSDMETAEELFTFPVFPACMNVYGTSVYYRAALEGTVYETNWETGQTGTVTGSKSNGVFLDGDQLYVTGTVSTPMRISLTTGETTALPASPLTGESGAICIGGDIYCVSGGRPAHIGRCDPDTGAFEEILTVENNNVLLMGAGDWLFAQTSQDNRLTYAVHLPSGTVQPFVYNFSDLETDDLSGWMDAPIVWKDAAVETCVRMALGRPDGDITYSDAQAVEQLHFANGAIGSADEHFSVELTGAGMVYQGQLYQPGRIGSLEDLKWFVNLRRLTLMYCHVTCSLSPLASLEHLEELDLHCLSSMDGLGELKQVKTLWIAGADGLDLSTLKGMTGLEYIALSDEKLERGPEEYAVLGELPSLKTAFLNCTVSRAFYDAVCAYCPGVEVQVNFITEE